MVASRQGTVRDYKTSLQALPVTQSLTLTGLPEKVQGPNSHRKVDGFFLWPLALRP